MLYPRLKAIAKHLSNTGLKPQHRRCIFTAYLNKEFLVMIQKLISSKRRWDSRKVTLNFARFGRKMCISKQWLPKKMLYWRFIPRATDRPFCTCYSDTYWHPWSKQIKQATKSMIKHKSVAFHITVAQMKQNSQARQRFLSVHSMPDTESTLYTILKICTALNQFTT